MFPTFCVRMRSATSRARGPHIHGDRGTDPDTSTAPAPKKPPSDAREILVLSPLPLPPGSARLRRARYNNAPVAKTTRETNSCLKKEKGGETNQQTKKKVAALFLWWEPNPSQCHPCAGNPPQVWTKQEEEIPAPSICLPPQGDVEGAWTDVGKECAAQRLG